MEDTTTLTTVVTSSVIDLTMYAWLDAKFHKSTSEKTRRAYTETIQQFRALLQVQGLDLGSNPAAVALVAQAFASASRRDKQMAPATHNQRLAIISSFYAYARRQGPQSPLYLEHNPIDTLERAKVQEYAGARAG